MKKISIILTVLVALIFTACQDKDIERAPMRLQAINAEEITGNLTGDDYTWTWPQLTPGQSMYVMVYEGSTLLSSETVTGNSFTHKSVQTNVPFVYVFKVSDGENVSSGVVKNYTREGATQITGLSMSQVEKGRGYDAAITWNKTTDATSIDLIATNGTRTIHETLSGSVYSYTIPNVVYGDTWNVTLRAINDKGTSMATTSSLKIGKTAIAFLSIYATPEELIANGDDDEASAWLWLHKTYPNAQFVYFGNIKSATDMEPYRVAFWLRDLEQGTEDDVWSLPAVVNSATPYISEWYKNGGNILLWQHATAYLTNLGRFEQSLFRGNDHTIGIGRGGINNDNWSMGACLNIEGSLIDFTTHPIYKGIPVRISNGIKLIDMKGPGWTEDHNCLYFNIPSVLSGIANDKLSAYTTITETYGIYPLGVWDSQIRSVSQLNVWECRQGNSDFKGTAICIGNGGCEFSMRNADGSADVSAHPKNNVNQESILKLAKNSIEYLKTR
jgi:fibronectin type III domain protein